MLPRSTLILCLCGILPTACVVPSIDTNFSTANTAGTLGQAGVTNSTGLAGATVTGGSFGQGSTANAGRATGGSDTSPAGRPSGGAAPGAGSPSVFGGSTAAGGNSTGGSNATGGFGLGGVTTTAGRPSGGATPAAGSPSVLGGSTSTGGNATGGAVTTGGQVSTAGKSATAGAASIPRVATAISAGLGHSCALVDDGTVWCWGNNYHGELGNEAPLGTDVDVVTASNVPVQVHNVADAAGVAAGSFHSCAVLKSGGVKCWGQNDYGQLGNGASGPSSNKAVDVLLSTSKAMAVVAGELHSCALLTDQTVKCWGANESGQLGNGSTSGLSTTPGTVVVDSSATTALTSVASLALTNDHTCAVLTDHSVYCWGRDAYGQLGDELSDSRGIAGKALNVSASAAGVGLDHTCIISSSAASSGVVQCWGYNWNGELGNATTDNSEIAVSTGFTALAIGLGMEHSCAISDDGTGRVFCWGRNQFSQLGDGTTSDHSTPRAVFELTQAKAVAGGDCHTCAIVGNGSVYCWGSNWFGQLGDGKGAVRAVNAIPVRVLGF